MRSMILSSQPEPSRHGVHWPHDSREKNLVMRQAARTVQVWSSMTTTEPEPSMEPAVGHLVLAEGQVDLVGPEPRGRHAAGDERLELPAVRDAAAEHRGVDQVAEGGLDHLELEDAGVVDVAGQGEQPGAGGPALAQGGEGGAAVE